MPHLRYLLLSLLLIIALSGCEKIETTAFDAEIALGRWASGLESATVTVGDTEWAYLKNTWKDDQETVVLLHGFAANKDNWPRFAKALGDGYNIIAPDLPGHGDSSPDIKLAYDIDSQSRRVLSMLKALGIEKFHVAGNSMGGAIAARTAWIAPEKTLSVGLFNAAGVITKDNEFTTILRTGGKNPLIVHNPGEMANLLEWAMAKPPFMPWPIESVMERKSIARGDLNEKIFKDMIGDGTGTDLSAILPKVTAPTLVLWGDQDRLISVASADVFISLMPNARKVILPGIGHLPMMEAAEESAKHYSEFLSSH